MGLLSMSIEVIQKDFQRSLTGGLAGISALVILGFGCCAYWGGQNIRAVVGQPGNADSASAHFDVQPFNPSIRESCHYLVADHNLAEGTVLTAADLKVVKMPGLHGYELAFSGPEKVIGDTLTHALPEGQPVLPYHVERQINP